MKSDTATVKQPVDEFLERSSAVLIAGAGGGYNGPGAVPVLSELQARGIPVHLASLPFTNQRRFAGARCGSESRRWIELALTAIAQAHKAAGHPSPRSRAPVQAVRRGIRGTLGTSQRLVAPICIPELRAMIAAPPQTLEGMGGRALFLVGFAGAFRRRVLVAVDAADLAFGVDGLVVLM